MKRRFIADFYIASYKISSVVLNHASQQRHTMGYKDINDGLSTCAANLSEAHDVKVTSSYSGRERPLKGINMFGKKWIDLNCRTVGYA